MKYLNSYVQAPTTPPGPTNPATGTNQVAHRRKNQSGGYSAAVIISGVTFPNTLIYQTYNDSGNLAGDEILVRGSGGSPWYKLPQSALNSGVATIPGTISTSWESVTPAELADNQDQFSITALDFGTFSSASEPSQTVYLLNDGTQTINLLDLTVNASDGATLSALDGRVRVDYEGVYGTIGVGNPDTAANGSLVYALGGKNSYPITIGPKGVAKLTLNLVNFPATGLDSSALAAEFAFNPNRAGYALPQFLDWQDGGLLIGPQNSPVLASDDSDSLGVLVEPFTVRVGGVIYQSTLEQVITPQTTSTGAVPCHLFVTSTGVLGITQTSIPVPTGGIVLGTLTWNTSTGSVTDWRLTSQPQADRKFVTPNALLTPGRGVTLDLLGLLVHGSPSLGVAVSDDGYFVPYGYALCEVGANVSPGTVLSADEDGIYQPDPEGNVYAQASGESGELVLCLVTYAAGTSEGGGGGSSPTNITIGRSATTVTVESDTGTDGTIAAATTSLAGVLTASDKTKLDGIATGATVTNLSFVRDTTTLTLANSGGSNVVLPSAATNLAGLMSAADKTKLDGLTSGAITATLGATTWTVTHFGSIQTTATLGMAFGGNPGMISGADKAKLDGIATGATVSNLGNTPAASTLAITNSGGAGTTLPAATTSLAGVMSSADKTKLDGIATGATVSNLGNTPTATTVAITNSGGDNTTLPAATTSLAGVLTAADKTKLDGLTTSTTTLTLVNGWSNFGSGFRGAVVSKTGNVVSVQGLIAGGTVAAGTVLTTLPVGHRPPATLMFPGQCSGGTLRLDVNSSGQILLGGDLTAGAAPATYLSLALSFVV